MLQLIKRLAEKFQPPPDLFPDIDEIRMLSAMAENARRRWELAPEESAGLEEALWLEKRAAEESLRAALLRARACYRRACGGV